LVFHKAEFLAIRFADRVALVLTMPIKASVWAFLLARMAMVAFHFNAFKSLGR
jgi:hypothetical protein